MSGGTGSFQCTLVWAIFQIFQIQRYDRDNYVKIIFENIEEEYKYQFQKREEKYSETFEKVLISKILYDYCSLMHYPEYAFAKLRYYFLIINIKLLYFPSLQNETEPTIEPLKSMKELECKNIG